MPLCKWFCWWFWPWLMMMIVWNLRYILSEQSVFNQVGGWVAGVAIVCGGDLSIFVIFMMWWWAYSYGVILDIFIWCDGRHIHMVWWWTYFYILMINNVRGDVKCDLRKKLCVSQSAIPQKLKRNFNVHVSVEAFFHSTLLFQIFHTLTLTAPPI